jgi:hypothetical protein
MPSALWWRCFTPVGTQATGTPNVSVMYRVELPLAYAVCTKPNLQTKTVRIQVGEVWDPGFSAVYYLISSWSPASLMSSCR